MPPGRQRPRALGPDAEIPEKLYFKIGEVAALVGVQAHVLRYWEKEIPFIRPGKTTSNQRRYRRRDVEVFREIRRLLHQERYTLAGARRRLVTGERPELPALEVPEPLPAPAAPPPVDPARLERVKAGLREILSLVGEEP